MKYPLKAQNQWSLTPLIWNAVAIGGTGEAYFKVSNGVAKVGAGFSASAFFGGGIKLNGELDFNKFSPYKLFDY